MANNLYRFDGYQYKQYYSHFLDKDLSLKWTFYNIITDSDGVLLISTINGLFRYNRISDSFDAIYEEKIDNVNVDNLKNIWVRKERIWSILDKQNKSLFTPLYNGNPISSINHAFCPYNNDLYISSYESIYRYNYSTNEFSLCTLLPDKGKDITSMKGHKGKLWILVQDRKIYKLDLTTYTIESHFDIEQLHSESAIRVFNIDKNGNLWIGTMEGLYIIDTETKKYKHYYHSKSDPFSLPNNSIWSIDEDSEKNLWIGTYSGGLCYVNLEEKTPFKSYIPYVNQLNHAPISAFAEDQDYLWIGTEGGGVNQLNKNTGQFDYLKHLEGTNSLAHNNIKSLVVDKNNNLWIGMYKGGVDCYDKKTKKIRHYKAEDKNSIYNNNIRKMIPDEDKGIWIIYQELKHILSFYSYENETFEHFIFSDENGLIFDIAKGLDNQLWMISNKNIFLMDVKNKTFKTIEPHKSVFMNFRTLCLDDSGLLWLGTIGKGLIKYNPYNSEFTFYGNILDSNMFSIYAISHDNNGNLWLGTDNGLIQYNISDGTHFRYNKKDGVQGQVYYHLASMKGANGNLYFGGTNGFTIIEPEDINFNDYKPKAIISDFLIDYIPTKINLTNEIVLNYDQNNFGFHFSSDNYLIPEKNHFKYRLKGYDDRWIEVNASNRTAFYSKVPAGTYYFEVLASNNDGVWSNVPTIIKIKRKPAPWFSWPAYVTYIAFFLFIVYLIYRYYSEKKRLKLQLYLDQLEKQKKEEIHQSQLRFFTNISHDFRTPLSLILATLEKLRQEGLKEYYYRILNSNTSRLLNLVNELMDFRTVENGKMKLELQQVNINTFVEKIAADFIDYAKQRNISYEIKNNQDIPPVYIDVNILEKIIMNLLNNAFKYTQKGNISIEVYADGNSFHSNYATPYSIKGENMSQSCFAIAVRDSGVGISEESIENVFERFYKVNTINFDSHLGTGIGLALVKSFTLLHKGSISVFSERNKGTDIVIYLPTDISVYNENDFLYKEPVEETEKVNVENINSDEKADIADTKKAKKCILLVEDNTDLRKIIADFLSDTYEIIQAKDGMEASKLVSKKRIDLIISDIMMPKKDGITLSKEIKENIEYSHIPIMLLTAKTSLESKIEGADSGADFYFEKPFDMNLLKLTLQNIFNHQKQLKDHYAKNYFVEGAELAANERESEFLNKLIKTIEDNLKNPEMDIQFIASNLSMSRSKLYRKVKTMTDKSIVEFILQIKLKKAAILIAEGNISIRQIMDEIGIESQAYFTNAFKKEFGETPSSFANKHQNTNHR